MFVATIVSESRSESPGPTNPTFSAMRRVRPDTVLGQAPSFLQGNNVVESAAEILSLVGFIVA